MVVDGRGWGYSPARRYRWRCCTAPPATSRARTSDAQRRTAMGSLSRMMLVATLLVALVRAIDAEPEANPSGHWEGALEVPSAPVTVEVDLARDRTGQL